MNESSSKISLTLTVYADMGSTRYVLLVSVIMIYIITILASVTLMLLIVLDTSLHKPMYIFLFSLILNGLMGSTAVWPIIMNRLLTNDSLISYEACLTQAFVAVTYGACNFSMLTVMAYDRVVSIFKPLQYHNIMTAQRVKLLTFMANFSPAAIVLGQIWQSSQIALCKYQVHKMFCDILAITSVSCDGYTIKRVSNVYSMINIFLFAVLPMVLILTSYVKILVLSLKVSRNTRKKAFETCIPHLIIFVNFSLVTLISLFYNRFNPQMPVEVHIILTVNCILIPPLMQPIIYGIRTKEIRQSFLRARRKTVFALSEYQLAPKFASSSVFPFCMTVGLKQTF